MTKQINQQDNDQLIDAQDLAQAFESTMHVVQGHNDALPDLLQHTGKILVKLSSRLTTTQMVLLVGALTLGAVFMVKRAEQMLDDEDSQTKTRKPAPKTKALSGGGS